MTTMFKKTLIAAALTAVAGSAVAGNLVQPTVNTISKQGITALTVAPSTVVLNPDRDYEVGSTITVTYSGGELAVAPTATCVDSITTVQNDCTGVTFTRTQTANSATFTVTGAAIDNTAVDGEVTISIGGAEFTRSSLANVNSVSATVQVKANTGVVIDEATTGQALTRTVLAAFDQATSTVTAGTKQINLASLRTKFNGSGADAKTATFVVNTTTVTTPAAAGGITYAAFTGAPVADKTDYVVAGDFSFLKDTDAAKDGIQPAAGSVTFTDTANCSLTSLVADKMIYSCTNAATAGGFTLDVYQGGTASPIALPDATFKVSAEKLFKNGSTDVKLTTLTSRDVMTFTNDGQSFAVDYMPISEKVSSVIYLKNYSDVAGAVYVTAIDKDGKKVLDRVNVGTAPKSGTFHVSLGLATELAKAKFAGGPLALKIDAEVTDAQVFSAYNADGDRLNSAARKLNQN